MSVPVDREVVHEAGGDAARVQIEIRVAERDDGASHSNAESSQAKILRWAILAAVMVVVAAYVGFHLGDGWVPADDGILGQSALRVAQGQLPHRDFAEIYSGGLSLLHGLAFRIFGVKLMSLRYCVFLFFLVWVAAVYLIATRFTSAPAAGLITLLAVSWSYPNYPAAMPSWYNLFFATFGACALLRYLDAPQRRWLFVAGVCGGISLAIKVIGAYYIAGVLLFLAFVEQSMDCPSDCQNDERRGISYRVFSGGASLVFLATIFYFFHRRLGIAEGYLFVLPAAALVAMLIFYPHKGFQPGAPARFRRLFGMVVPFTCGVAAPLCLFLIPYARSGAVSSVFTGIMGSVAERSVGLGVIRPLTPVRAIYALSLMGVIAAAMYLRELQGKLVGFAVSLGLLALLWKSNQDVVSGTWSSVALLTPLVVVAGTVIVLRTGRSGALTSAQQQRIVLLIGVAGLCSYVQFPFAAPIYLLYSLPLTLLAAVAMVTYTRQLPGTIVIASVMVFYMLFGFVNLIPDHIYELTHKLGPFQQLSIERGAGLRVEAAPWWGRTIQFLQQHGQNGTIYAGNDCPQLYFLSGLENATRDDAGATDDEVMTALQSDKLKLVVINERPFFAGSQMSPRLRAEIIKRFPEQRMLGIFRVLWRQ